MNRRALAIGALLAACVAPTTGPTTPPPLAATDGTAPPPLPTSLGYDRAALDAAREAAARDAADPDAPEAQVLGGRRVLLDGCAADLRGCPPVLTIANDAPLAGPLPVEPTLAVAWARDAHAAACSCASLACVDGWTERLREVEADATPAATSGIAIAEQLTWARECLTTLRRGRR